MKSGKAYFFSLLVLLPCSSNISGRNQDLPLSESISITITKKYLNFPVSQKEERSEMSISAGGRHVADFTLRLASEQPDYWVFMNVSQFIGKQLSISYNGNKEGLQKIYLDDVIAGQDSLYKESNRPQIHFTSRRGWNNDPNGLIFYEGEYHMFYQHNPFEREWGNMSWGHAVSRDLIHWEELPVVMYPDELGAIFSGTAVIDYRNTSGFGKDGIPPMVAIYTSDSEINETQCLAYSLNRGRTFTKYSSNPVIDSKSKWNTKDLRDPKVFWHEPSKSWVMVLFERDGNSIYTSPDLKNWQYESHVAGFWECPQLFELPVAGDRENMKWVMYGASGTYMTGKFNGKQFIPESGKYCYGNGALYAAQVFENIPSADGRIIQIGWGRIQQPGMPFNQMMLLPTTLNLRTTKDGIRLFNYPVDELNMLVEEDHKYADLDAEEASGLLQQFSDEKALWIKTKIHLSHATDAGLTLDGQALLRYDMNFNQVNGAFYSPEDPEGMEITADIIIDRTSAEVFIDNGAFSYAIERRAEPGNRDGFRFFGNKIQVTRLEVKSLRSIWN